MYFPGSSTGGRLRSIAVAALCSCTALFAQTPPTITSFSPSTISIGMPVTIIGSNFTGNVTVRFGNATGTNTVINSPTQVTSVVPTSLTVPGNITVTTSGGVATSPTSFALDLAPAITGFTPAVAPVNRMVTVSGYNFLGTAISNRTITLNGTPVSNITVSSNRVTFPVPVGATTGPIAVHTNQGSASSSSNIVIGPGFPVSNDNFANALVVSGSSGGAQAHTAYATKEPSEPNHGGNPGGASLWFEWTAPATRWYLFNPHQTAVTNFGVLLSIYTGNSVEALTSVASASANAPFSRYSSAAPLNAVAGTTYRIALDGYNGLMGDFRLNWSELNPPTISSVPSTVFAGQIGNVTISGNGFTPIANVTIGGVPVPANRTTVNSPTSLSVTQIPLNAAVGPAPVIVSTPVGTIASSALLNVTAPPIPVIGSFSPASGDVGTSITFSGVALALAEQPVDVRFNGVPATSVTVLNSGSISALVPAGAMSGPITITTSAGTGTSSGNFTVNPPAAPPVIGGFTPGSGPVGSAIVITGQNFFSVTSVLLGGVPASFAVDSPTQITAFVPSGVGSGLITVSTVSGSAVTGVPFVVTQPPVITSFSPTELSAWMRVVITGTGFANATMVQFNGVSTGFTVVSDTQIVSALPPGAGPGQIAVTTPNGTTYSPTAYTISPPAVPTISGFSPATIGAGLPVTINGSGFSDVTSVMFNHIAVNFTVISPNTILANAPSSGLVAGPIVVSTSLGTAVSPTNYSVSLAPFITGITPASAPVNRVITVQGANFSGANVTNVQVRVNGVPVGSNSRSTTSITFAVPPGATTGPITVQTSQGFATSPMPLIVEAGPPPANDHFASAQLIAGSSGVLLGNTANATKQPGEPNHAANPGGASVWFRWVAPASGLYLFNPSNGSSSQFGIIQSIYTGSSVDALTLVASGLTPTNVFARYGSAAVLDAVAGTMYHIALDGYNGVMADYRLSWSPLGPPTIAGFNPNNGLPGQTSPTISVFGSNFTPGSPLLFNGTPVSPTRITYQNPNAITVTQIPEGATTGPLSITTPAGTATSSAPFVIGSVAPTIASFSPGGAKVGTPVTINGANFGGTTAVLFNGTATSNLTVSGNNTFITTAVPDGATTGPITVVTPGGQAVSSTPFVVIVPPVIVSQPQSQTATAFSNVVFSVSVSSNGPEEYQWTRNGAPIFGNPSADDSSLVLGNVTMADAGIYECRIGNNAGFVTTQPATLTVTKAPALVALANLAATYDGTPKAASATTLPPGLTVRLTYDGSTTPPSNAGSYAVAAVIDDVNYAGSTSAVLYIAPAPAAVHLGPLVQRYDGSERVVTATTTPAGLPVAVSYDGSPTPPIYPRSYAVSATVTDPNYSGTRAGILNITTTALVRHAPALNAEVHGSVYVLLPENVVLAGNALVSGDLLVPGTPFVRLSGQPIFGSTLDGPGAADPTGHTITLAGRAVLRHVVRRVEPVAINDVAIPPVEPVGDVGLEPLHHADLVLPPGVYSGVTLSGNSRLVLGVPGGTTPAVYVFRRLDVGSRSRIELAGPVVLTIAEEALVSGTINAAETANDLAFRIVQGGLTLHGGASLAGHVTAPRGAVTLNAATLVGSVIADQLQLNGNSVLKDPVE